MAAGMAFCLLGPLTVRVDGAAVPIPRGKQRVLLAALLLNAGQTVTADRLAELMWRPAPPSSAGVTLQNYVKRLRQALGPGRSRIVTQPGGYRIHVDPGELDVTAMETAVAAAGRAARAGAWPAADRQASAALALWRGAPLSDIESEDLTASELPRLTELWFQARELRIEAGLQLGGYAEHVAGARQLFIEAPLREHSCALLMRALQGSGRQAEALGAYQDARRMLVDELGCEPGSELQDLHRRILAGDPELPSGPGSEAVDAGARSLRAPRQLPAALPGFVGRAAELRTMTSWTADAPGLGAGVVSGPAGIGKTSLALHWAHEVADQFRDGQVFLDLNGFGPAGLPTTPAEAVGRLLEALQVPPARVPASFHGQVGLYRSLLSQRRMLLVLDNARDEDQVRPLLPGSAGCLAVVTSRASLAGLVAVNGARTIVLPGFSDEEARQMVSRRLGRADGDSDEAMAQLAAACARLPLALAIATALVATRPGQPLADVADELTPVRSRLDILDAGEHAADIRSVFSWSYRALSPDTARLFRLLAEHPGPDISVAAAASLAGVPPDRVGVLLRELASLHLVNELGRGRFSLHDLLRLYAADMLAAHEPGPERQLAARRMLAFYLHSAWAAARALSPGRPGPRLDDPPPGTGAEGFSDDGRALSWLTAEHHVITRIIAYAARTGEDASVCTLALALTDFFDRGGHWAEMAAAQRMALAAAERLGDVRAQARAHQYIGRASFQLQDFAAALSHLAQGAALVPGSAGEASMSIDLTRIHKRMGNTDAALPCAQRALALYQSQGNPVGEVIALNAVGWCRALQGEFHAALQLCEQAVVLSREIDHKSGRAQAHEGLGYVRLRLGQPAAAIAEYRQAIGIYAQMRDQHSTALAYGYLGDAYQASRDLASAAEAWRDALVILDELDHPDGDGIREKLALAGATGQAPIRRAPGGGTGTRTP
jgi:DNA-binding SARP family transcriptional activator/tetratricopeptide (TPR) repeat protein